jgi:hypothetical protein
MVSYDKKARARLSSGATKSRLISQGIDLHMKLG